MNQMKINFDENVWKLIYYFVVMEGYNPIIIHGNEDEIWLEKMSGKYNVIRIAAKYIHNKDQLDYDYNKVDHIIKTIRKRALLFRVRLLNVFTNLNEDLNAYLEDNHIVNINFRKWEDINNPTILKDFPKIIDETNFKEKGEALLMKITEEINKKSARDVKRNAEIFDSKTPYITYSLIAINVLLFMAMYIFGNGSTHIPTLIDFGASYGPLIKNGEYYRLLTSGFIHIGLMHLLFNNYALFLIGTQLENFYGKLKYIIIYLMAIIISSLFSLVFVESSVSAGASGAIFGLLGAFLYFGYHHRIYLGNMMKSQIIPLILINLLIGFSIPGINNAAHIGGLISGGMVAASLGIKYKTTLLEQINAIVITIIFTCFLIYLGFLY